MRKLNMAAGFSKFGFAALALCAFMGAQDCRPLCESEDLSDRARQICHEQEAKNQKESDAAHKATRQAVEDVAKAVVRKVVLPVLYPSGVPEAPKN